jgi:pentatricopeptide repeat protein
MSAMGECNSTVFHGIIEDLQEIFKAGQHAKAIEFFQQMQQRGMTPNKIHFCSNARSSL